MHNIESKKQKQNKKVERTWAMKAKKKRLMTLEWCYRNFIGKHVEGEENIKHKERVKI
jgi:hypothetical protein